MKRKRFAVGLIIRMLQDAAVDLYQSKSIARCFPKPNVSVESDHE